MLNEKPSWSLRIFAALLGLIGLFLFCGGAWLLALGGSLYYIIAGAAILASSALLWIRNPLGSAIYQITAMATLLWAVWETGFDLWAFAARIALPLVLMAWLYTPWIRRSLKVDLHDDDPIGDDSWGKKAFWKKAAAGIVITILGGAALLGSHQIQAQTGARHAVTERGAAEDDWRHYGNSLDGSHYSTLNQINEDNISQLERAWTYRSGDGPRSDDADGAFAFAATPIEINDTLYFCTPHSSVIALNADTGEERWRFDSGADTTNAISLVCRGVAYYARQGANGACAQRIVGVTTDARLYALDAHTGELCGDFGENGFVSLVEGMGAVKPGTYFTPSPPTIVGNRILIGGAVAPDANYDAASGVIRAFNVRDGRREWVWDMGRTTNIGEFTRATPHASAPFAADPDLGLVYVGTGSPPLVTDGTELREFDKRYANSIVALQLSNGNPRWSFQTTRGDVWNYGLVAQPVLVNLFAPGSIQRALVQVTKYGDVFVLDRATGRQLRQSNEVAAPAGIGLPLSTIQLRSEISFLPEPLTERDMWGVTPLDHLVCRIKFKRARYEGPFTPPGLKPTITYPGAMGNIGWGGIAMDQRSKLIVANTNAIASYDRMVRQADGSYRKQSEPFLGPLGAPCNEPPWGFLELFDLKTNEHIWKHPIGTTRDSGPLGIPSLLPLKIGTPTLGGLLVTEGTLSFHAGTLDNYLRAYGLYTGEELWSARLPAGGQASPMTYTTSSGRQFIVIAAGGHAHLGTKTGDYVVAYALPES
jgi:quinoprotein glucose dehydrogenase